MRRAVHYACGDIVRILEPASVGYVHVKRNALPQVVVRLICFGRQGKRVPYEEPLGRVVARGVVCVERYGVCAQLRQVVRGPVDVRALVRQVDNLRCAVRGRYVRPDRGNPVIVRNVGDYRYVRVKPRAVHIQGVYDRDYYIGSRVRGVVDPRPVHVSEVVNRSCADGVPCPRLKPREVVKAHRTRRACLVFRPVPVNPYLGVVEVAVRRVRPVPPDPRVVHQGGVQAHDTAGRGRVYRQVPRLGRVVEVSFPVCPVLVSCGVVGPAVVGVGSVCQICLVDEELVVWCSSCNGSAITSCGITVCVQRSVPVELECVQI